MPFEQVAEFEIFAEHIEAFMAAEPLQFRRVDAAVHAGGERAALETVPAELAPPKAGCDRARLNDESDRLRRQGESAKAR